VYQLTKENEMTELLTPEMIDAAIGLITLAALMGHLFYHGLIKKPKH